MYFRTNDFTDSFKRDSLTLDVAALSALRGQSFDVHNDCWIDYRGEHIHVRGVSKPVSIERLGILGAAEEALRVWERTRNGDSAFAAYYAERLCPMFHLSSSRRINRLSFDSLESALAFLASRKLSQETVCITDSRGDIVHIESFN